jgi:tetratricopeptide (TPR) repeat protein
MSTPLSAASVLLLLLSVFAGAPARAVEPAPAKAPDAGTAPAPAPANDELLARVHGLITAGARGLAVHIIDEHQSPNTPVEKWMQWERLRVKAYQASGDWKALVQRADRLIPDLPPEFVNWITTEAARAELSSGDGAGARRLLRRLLWRAGPSTSEDRARWRRLVIRSYLVDDRVDDARVSLLRYLQDYHAQGDAWMVLRATVLLRSQRDAEAFRVLVGVDTDEARLLRLYAALQTHAYKTRTITRALVKLAQRKRLDRGVRRSAWTLLADAARRSGDPHLRALALEHALILPPVHGSLASFFPVKADDLWQAYTKLAEQVGNRDRLLVGDDAPWLRKAKAVEKKDPVTARALYAFLALNAASHDVQALSHRKLTDSLYDAGGTLVVTALYTESERFASLDRIPAGVRVRLVNEALKVHDIKKAARLMKDFAQPPEGEDADQWVLRRARTLVYAGDPVTAAGLLEKLISVREKFPPKLAHRVTQVLFDLQAVKENKEAFRLLQALYDRVDDTKTRRELLYWMADSKSALDQYQDAAELYLRSAAMGPAGDKDLWGQSARFHAAEALANAGLAEDAGNVFTALLRVTQEPEQRALIERKIQQLWLVKSKATTQ